MSEVKPPYEPFDPSKGKDYEEKGNPPPPPHPDRIQKDDRKR